MRQSLSARKRRNRFKVDGILMEFYANRIANRHILKTVYKHIRILILKIQKPKVLQLLAFRKVMMKKKKEAD